MSDINKLIKSNQQNGHQKTALLQERAAFAAVLTSRDTMRALR